MSQLLRRLGVALLTLIVAAGAAWTVQARVAASPVTIKVVFEENGPPPYQEANYWKMVSNQVTKAYPNIHVSLQPVVAAEGPYYTKVDLMMRSASTAPDLVKEDSFLIGSDATAGYLQPLNSYLSKWPQYKQQWFQKMQQITTFQGKNYGIMNGTDVRLVWYNKNIFKKAGLPTTWQPHNWNDILKAARTIKAKVHGVTPLNLYSGIPGDEASTMQGFEMLLYGTGNPLYDYGTNKWIVSSKGFMNALKFVQTVYNSKDLLGPSNDVALNASAGNIVAQQLLPQGKLAIDIDGSWLPTNWQKGGVHPWAKWNTVLGHAKMPTEFGQAPHYVTLSGGWSYAISSKSKNKAAAWDVLKVASSRSNLAWYDVHIANIGPRRDEVKVSSYKNVPLSPYFSQLLSFTQFRPAFPVYPRISNDIDKAMQEVMSGTSPSSAMSQFASEVKGTVGSGKVETKP